jgi:superoxide reductase
MATKLEIYKCTLCGNIVEILTGGDGELVCCGQPMKHLAASTADAATEKHVPVVEKLSEGVRVTVGEVHHPMEEKHYIQWIQIPKKSVFQEMTSFLFQYSLL